MKRVATWLTLVLFVALLEAAAAAEPTSSGFGWQTQRLDLTIRIHENSEQVTVEGTVWLRAEQASFGPTLGVNNRETVMRIEQMTARDRAGVSVDLETRHDHAAYARLATVRSEKPFEAGDVLALDFVLGWVGDAPQAVKREDFVLISWVEAWYPVPLVPGDDPFSAEKMGPSGPSTFLLPAGWSAVSNGRRSSRVDTGGGTREVWSSELPLSRAFTAAPFQVETQSVEGLDVGVYRLSASAEDAHEQALTLARVLQAMEARFGPYPYPNYAIAEVPEGIVSWYAASEQGYITAATRAFEVEGGNIPLFAHEAAHGWWGNQVSSSGNGSKLCGESLAQYGAVIAIETLEGPDAMREFLEYSREGYSARQSALGYFGIVREGGDKPMSELSNGRYDHNLSDSKGHWVYHMLRRRVGDDVFFDTLRGLLRDFAGKEMTLDDVRAAFIAAVPDDSGIEGFLAQWLDRKGAPVLDATWVATGNGATTELLVNQTQPGEPYVLELPVELVLLDKTTQREVLDIQSRETRVVVDTPSRVVELRLDPDVELLLWRNRYGPVPDSLSKPGG